MASKEWRIAFASAIGLAHINQNTECQDRLACEIIETKDGKVLLAIVADGAGSSSDGQIGAETACKFFIKGVTDLLSLPDASISSLNLEFGKLWVTFFQKKIAEIATKEKKELRDFASTLVAAIIGDQKAVFYQVGDGGAVYSVSGEQQSYKFAIEPEETEYINVTEFLTDDNAVETMRFIEINEEIEDLILFSDGIFPVAVDYQANKPHEPFLMPMIAPLRKGLTDNLNEKLLGFLNSAKINEKTDDDKTIILATRNEI